jgi:hypothetical protein
MTASGPPQIELHYILLTPEVVLSGTQAGDGDLRRRMSFGEWAGAFDPEWVPSTEWRRLVRAAGPAARFCHLSIACSFGPETPDEPGTFIEGQLSLDLRSDGQRPPMARAMHPLNQEGPTFPAPERTVTAGAGLSVASIKVSTRQPAASEPKWAIVGFGLHQSTPYWKFLGQPDHPLHGTYLVDALIELGDGGKPVAAATLDARLMQRRRLRWYHEDQDSVRREIPLA